MRNLAHLLVLCLVLPTFASAESPSTEPKPVREMLHGVEIVDPYRWLEGSDAPEVDEDPALDARVAEWTQNQNQHTRSVLDTLAGRGQLEERIGELLEVGSIGTPQERGGWLFNTERKGREAQASLYVRRGLDGEPRRLIDPNTLDGEGLTTLGWYSPSPDGSLVAFGLFHGGDENSTLHVLRTENGEWLADEISGRVGAVSWMPDNATLVYRRLASLDNPYSGQIKLHRLGTHHRQDPLLFEQYKEGPLATTFGPYAFLDTTGRWLTMIYHTGTQSNDLWLFDMDHWQKTGELKRVDLLLGEEAQSNALVLDGTAYVRTTLDAPNGRLLAVDLENPAREHWKELIPERSDAVLEYVLPAKDLLVTVWLEKASTRVELFDRKGQSKGPLNLPGLGSAGLSTQHDSSQAFLSYESYNEPDSIYSVDLDKGDLKLWARPEVPVDPSQIVVRQVTYPSKDGTEVTLFLVHRKDLEKNGKNPTILYGYGGFNVSMTPSFSSRAVPWVERGGIFAVANLRGGGEYGDAWHRDGMLERKQNVFDDFIAAGEYLIEEGYTNADQLGVWGGSNGGLLTGAVLVQRPELFSAVISAVPLLDMLRYHHFLMARYWIPEYGSSEDPEQLAFIHRYSPYHNVNPGTAYPATLLTAGENDARVHPLHARKMAAQLQAATKSDPTKEPILLWVEGDVGHGRGKPLALRQRDLADQLIFFAWQLGLPLG